MASPSLKESLDPMNKGKINKYEIKRGMILVSKRSRDYQIEVQRKDGRRWKVAKLTDRTGVYNGSHTMTQITIWKNFDPV